MSNVLLFENVSKIYKSDIFKKTQALHEFSLSVKQGEIFGIVGPNGAGKSTVLKILLGFVLSSLGTVTLSARSSTDLHKSLKVGYLPENPCLYRNLTPADHLFFAGETAGYTRVQSKKRIEELLSLVGLEKEKNTKIRKFSKGMTQRAALAYALFDTPEILILDEPMSGLDPVGRKQVTDIILRYNNLGNTVLFCSHILTDVRKLCHRIGIMHRGRLEKILNTDEIHNDIELDNLFFSTIARQD